MEPGQTAFETLAKNLPPTQTGTATTWFLEYFNVWGLVFGVLVLELLRKHFTEMALTFSVCTTIVVPLPNEWRRKMLNTLTEVWNFYPRARIVIKTLMAIVLFLFVDSLREMYMLHLLSASPALLSINKSMDLDLVAAQRNAFISGFTIYLFGMLYRFQSMSNEVSGLESTIQELRKRQTETLTEPTYKVETMTEPEESLTGMRQRPIQK